MAVDLEERVTYKVVAQNGGALDVEFTLGTHKVTTKVFWDGVEDVARKVRDAAPIEQLRAAALPPPPPPPPIPNVVGRQGHILLISVPDLP